VSLSELVSDSSSCWIACIFDCLKALSSNFDVESFQGKTLGTASLFSLLTKVVVPKYRKVILLIQKSFIY
jgi:hypothetical protein